jgi:hypothetical protein
MASDSVYGFMSDRLVLAPGAIVQLGPIAGLNAVSIKLLVGGTLEIGGYSSSLAQGFTSLVGSATNLANAGQTFGVLYPLQANEIYSGNMAGKIYLYASSATCTVAVSMGRSQGY